MIKDTIRALVLQAATAAQVEGAIPAITLPAFDIERPQFTAHGDYATNIAMKLASELKRTTGQKANPRALGEAIAERARRVIQAGEFALIGSVEVAGAGFINFRLEPRWVLSQIDEILAAGDHWGEINLGNGLHMNLEYVSANPTGQVHVGNGRGAFIGDALASVLLAAGYRVTREYYFNDAGQQIIKLGRSMEYYYRLACGEQNPPCPEEGYFGDYYLTVAQRLIASGKEYLSLPPDERVAALGRDSSALIMEDIRCTMASIGVRFDVWFNQYSLETSGALWEGIAYLREHGYIEEREGALWMKTTLFGDDKDWVIVKSNGEPTYIASDVAYMRDKFARGAQKLIYVLGPDHHGYISRLKATAGMIGHDPNDVIVLIYQNVSVKGERIGKRLGNAIPLDDLVAEVGPDVTRFFYLHLGNNAPLDFDLELAKRQSDENPVYYVQYGHARIASILRKAAERGIADYEAGNPAILADDPEAQRDLELTLVKHMLRLPEVVERVATELEPHHLPRYAIELAAAFHAFYHDCPVLRAENEATRRARLKLVCAAKLVLARSLSLVGVSVPERMERLEDEQAAGD